MGYEEKLLIGTDTDKLIQTVGSFPDGDITKTLEEILAETADDAEGEDVEGSFEG